MRTRFLIVGQGICGTLVSWLLRQRQEDFLVVDAPVAPMASWVARGLMNPVTGKRLADSWAYPTLLPEALAMYQALGDYLQTPLLVEIAMIQGHAHPEAAQLFARKADAGVPFLEPEVSASWHQWLRLDYGAGVIAPCWLVAGRALLTRWRQDLKDHGQLIETAFEPSKCTVTEQGIAFQGIEAEYLICCAGASAATMPWFENLPWAINKGEAAWVRIPDLPQSHIYHAGLKIIPLGDDLFWVGSSFEWTFDGLAATEGFARSMAQTLRHWLKVPFEILSQEAAARPATIDRRPVCGFHPQHPRVALVGGTGTKGFLQAPYTARHMIAAILDHEPIPADSHIQRFERALSR